jgi:isopentenyl phosphate kinase
LGHGSGSFGHFAAAETPLARIRGELEESDVEALRTAVSSTQDAAARLHRQVFAALSEAGLLPFSVAPSSWLAGVAGTIVAPSMEPIEGALRLGLLPVVYGDVVLDRRAGAMIASTEGVFELLARELARRSQVPSRAIWLGETDGILDAAGKPIARVSVAQLESVRAATQGSGGVDVTGGMRLRLETAWSLAAAGVPSLIIDGRQPGALVRAVRGQPAGGTWVEPPAAEG